MILLNTKSFRPSAWFCKRIVCSLGQEELEPIAKAKADKDADHKDDV